MTSLALSNLLPYRGPGCMLSWKLFFQINPSLWWIFINLGMLLIKKNEFKKNHFPRYIHTKGKGSCIYRRTQSRKPNISADCQLWNEHVHRNWMCIIYVEMNTGRTGNEATAHFMLLNWLTLVVSRNLRNSSNLVSWNRTEWQRLKCYWILANGYLVTSKTNYGKVENFCSEIPHVAL